MSWALILSILTVQNALAFSVKLEGAVSPASVRSVMNSVNKHMAAGELDLILRLDSEGGEIPSAVGLANFLYEKAAQGLHVTTYNRSKCNSACTIIFAAGKKRTANRGAQFYFHSVGVKGAGKDHDSVQLHWARIWSSQIALADPRLAQELEQEKTLIGQDNEETYYASGLFDRGYTYVTEIP